jgi:glycine C-acetyltransferase
MDTLSKKIELEIQEIQKDGLYKSERVIDSKQNAEITVNNQTVLNFCANNYLGLSSSPALVNAAKKGLDNWGLGLSSVRFICGTQAIHKELENKLSTFLHMEDTILYSSCFDANGGLFETLLDANDVIISDALNHASIIDGVRLCKAKRERYNHSSMSELEQILKDSQHCNHRLITTDGVFSMDGDVAKLKEICDLAEKYNALVHVDDSHATGFFGPSGRGSIDYCNVMDKVDIITSTLGKAMGGASGGFTSSSKYIIDLLRQRSRPYLFSNSLAPAIVSASIEVLNILNDSTSLLEKIKKNTNYFRVEIQRIGYTIKKGEHPIVPIMLGDAKLAQNIAQEMLDENIYVIGFSYPVVPKGEARIRVQISAAHSKEDIDLAIAAFEKVGHKYKVL